MEGATFHDIPTDFIISSRRWILVMSFCFGSPVGTSRVHSSTLWYNMCTKTSISIHKNLCEIRRNPEAGETKSKMFFLLFVRTPYIGYFVLRIWIRANPGKNGYYAMWKIHHSNNLFQSTKHGKLCFFSPGNCLLHLNRLHSWNPSAKTTWQGGVYNDFIISNDLSFVMCFTSSSFKAV